LARNLGEDRLSILDPDGVVFRKGAVRFLSDPAEPSTPFGNELLCVGGYAGLVLVCRAQHSSFFLAVTLHSIRGLATLIFQHCPLFYCKVIALK
jgi:hypothetical protein